MVALMTDEHHDPKTGRLKLPANHRERFRKTQKMIREMQQRQQAEAAKGPADLPPKKSRWRFWKR
jgi:ribosomal protein S10